MRTVRVVCRMPYVEFITGLYPAVTVGGKGEIVRVLVDSMPTTIEDCFFVEPVEVVKEDAIQNAEMCDECGGFILTDEDVDVVFGCILTGERCTLDTDGECVNLSVGYVTRF